MSRSRVRIPSRQIFVANYIANNATLALIHLQCRNRITNLDGRNAITGKKDKKRMTNDRMGMMGDNAKVAIAGKASLLVRGKWRPRRDDTRV